MEVPAKLRKSANVRRACVTVMTAAVLSCALSASAAALVEREYENAARSFRTGRFAEAFGRFVDLANRGDVDAARIALFMNAYGPALYGRQWDARPQDIAYWTTLVRNSGNSARPMPELQPAAVLASGKARLRPAPARSRP